MLEFKRAVYQDDLTIYQQAIGDFFPEHLRLVSSEPSGAAGIVRLTIAYRDAIDVFLLGLKVGRAKQTQEAHLPQASSYPQCFVNPRMRTYYRFSSPNTFIIVSSGQLQVRRDQPGQLYTVENERTAISEEVFVEAYRDYREGLLILTEMEPARYLHRGSPDYGWHYRMSDVYDQGYHLRLSVHTNEHGRNLNLLYALDTRPGDPRRTESTEEAFAAQLELVFQEADAAVFGTGQEGGQGND